jgi:hypothetical protein
MAKQGIKPINMTGVPPKTVLISMFFSVDISYVVEDLRILERFRKLR